MVHYEEKVEEERQKKARTPRVTTPWTILSKEDLSEDELVETVDALLTMPVWKSANGRLVPLNEMDDQHLDNAIKMVQTGRRANGESAAVGPHGLPHLEAEKKRRGL
jgi:hypothetical protein